MTSVERIHQYSKLEQEESDHGKLKPPPEWPKEGNISLQDVSLKYKGQTKPALGPINVDIKAQEKVSTLILDMGNDTLICHFSLISY